MNDRELSELTRQLIQPKRWSVFLSRFIGVLQINIFVVDHVGRVLVPPTREGDGYRFGADFLSRSFGFALSRDEEGLLQDFEPHDRYLEIRDAFDFHVFAVPIRVADDLVVGYLIVGPVVLGRKWSSEDYLNVAVQMGLRESGLLDVIDEIRVLSFVAIKAILDLLSEVVKDVVQLTHEKICLSRMGDGGRRALSRNLNRIAQDMYATIHLDEFLITVMDVALNLASAESGSIMLLDEKGKALHIRVSRGLDEQCLQSPPQALGEGLAGRAVTQNRPFFFPQDAGEEGLGVLLQRPDLRESAVIPLSMQNRVFGVLNLSARRESSRISQNVVGLVHLSKLISTAIKTI